MMAMKNIKIFIAILLSAGLLTGISGCKKADNPQKPATTPSTQSPPAMQHQTKPAQDQPKTAGQQQTVCPITGENIDKSVFVDYQGKRIYFCCSDCPPNFKANPEKYIKEMESKGIVLAKTPAP
jgi:YHS domain-containing protein